MNKIEKQVAIKDLRRIPGIGEKLAEKLWMIDIRSVRDLRGKNPEKLYRKLCDHAGCHIDRCVLYVFRAAVYFASNKSHEPGLLKWWHWKDRKINEHET